ncbi:MAG: Signal recognition particle 54 kDa protein [Pseudomonadota bacterium]|jgi:flagellar biosynthesis protein FlhF
MELKRILARDIRAANEKAVAQYGPDVLVISSGQVNGLTELIVAVDLAPLSPEEADPHVKPEYAQVGKPSGKFDVLLGQTIEQNKRQARERQATKVAKPIVEVAPKPAQTIAAKAKPTAKVAAMDESAKRAAEEHDTLRGREIVALVREELNSLRREFKLGQQMAAWQQGGMPLPAAVLPLRDALNDAPIPVALRALLIDNIKDHDNMADAMGALSRQLAHSVEQEQAPTPVSGIHALAGPSGAGKSMMVARLAQNAAQLHGSEKVMVISFQDQRAGAWNQTQLLCAQSGVDSFRATNASTLKLLLDEHTERKLILIDTAGVQMNERLAEIRAMNLNVQCHAVIPADASAANIRRVFDNTDNVWASLMLSKLDESTQPWALLQFLTDKSLSVSVASHGDRTSDLVQDVSLAGLVQCALDNLPLPETEEQAQQNARDAAVNDIASSKLAQIAAKFKTETTGLTHE